MFRTTTHRTRARRRYRNARIQADLSQVDAAIKAKIAERRYWKIENGYAKATPEENERLAKLFKVAPEQLVASEQSVQS